MKSKIPYSKFDQYAFNFLWTYSDALITSGEILRKEETPFEIDFKDLLLNEKDYNREGLKPVGILTWNPSIEMLT